MNEQLQAIATVVSPVNPAICGVKFVTATAGQSASQKLGNSTKAMASFSANQFAAGRWSGQ